MAKGLTQLLLVLAFFPCAAITAQAAEPANPYATPEAGKILDYLAQLPARYDRRVISGQQLGGGDLAARGLANAAATSGETAVRRVGLIGVDYGYPKSVSPESPALDRSALNKSLIECWRSGSLISISFLARNPWTGGSAWDTSVRNLDELVTSGTEASGRWTKELDSVAQALAELRDAGVVVLWRPLQDMNDGSFWWGKGDEPFRREGFVSLWRHMFDYFTRTKKLNNLLWVYSASSNAHRNTSGSAFFPGKEYCDIVSLDAYSTDFVWNGYNEMARLGKPFGIMEFGPSPDAPGEMDHGLLLDRIRKWYPLTTLLIASTGSSTAFGGPVGGGLIKDPWIISRDRLDWLAPGHNRWKQAQPLALKSVEVVTKDPACWKRVDIRIDLAATFDTPFDPEQVEVEARFSAPSGRVLVVPAFLDQPFERQVWGNGRFSEEVMAEAGPPEWHVRFMPSEPGEYRFSVRARDRSGSVESPVVTFSARASDGHGYVRVSSKDPHYFEFDDGAPYIPVGLNIVEHPLSEYYRYIPRLAQNGGNFSRLWIGFEYFGLELGPMGDYRLDNAWRLDQVMELSEQYGIYQKLCIDWIRHITPRGEPRRDFDREDYAYSVSNGGPCHDMREFFMLPEARRRFKNRLRYIVARWGYSPNVMAWELWNEIDMVDPKARDEAIIVPWNREMCRYLQSIDPWHHLTTNSLAGRDQWKAIWPMEENQFAQRHGYSTPRPDAVVASADMAGNVLQWLDDVAGFDKPYLMAEFGLQRDRMDVRALCDRDQNGVHMHAGIWAALAHGSAGTAQLWWWGQYVDPKNLYTQFQAVANFVKGVPWTTAGFVRADIRTPEDNLRAVGLRGAAVSIFWFQNKSHTWWNVVSRATIPPVGPTEVTVAGYAPGRYRLEYWDTYEGRLSSTATVRVTAGDLKLPVPRLETDIALKVYPVEP